MKLFEKKIILYFPYFKINHLILNNCLNSFNILKNSHTKT